MLRLPVALASSLGLSGLLVVGAFGLFAPDAPPLGVLNTSPESPADPGAVVTVTFDRPVAGGLEETVAAADVFRIEPQVEGTVEWRDPVTLRFTPAAPLEPGATYTVVVHGELAAMDGSRLPRPHRFSFTVERARVLTGHPAGPHGQGRFLDARPTFRVLLSSEAEPGELARAAFLQPDASCGGIGKVPLRVAAQRPIADDDPEWFRYHGARGNDPARDLRRVAELVPAAPLPPGCHGHLVVPQRLDEPTGDAHRWSFDTYGPLTVVEAGCGSNAACHDGPAHVRFSTPVKGSEVLRHVRLEPAGAFTVRDTAEASDRWILERRLTPRRRYVVRVDPALTDVFGQRLGAPAAVAFTTPAVPPSVIHPHGKLIVERDGHRTLAVQHVNVDTLFVEMVAVPDTLEAAFLAHRWGGWDELWQRLAGAVERRKVPVRSEADQSSVTGVRLPAHDARRGAGGTIRLVRVTGRGVADADRRNAPLALVQVTDLAVHARVGVDQAAVWVTGVGDGAPRAGVEVTLFDHEGRLRATGRTNGGGLVTLTGFRAPPPADEECAEGECGWNPLEGYVAARLGEDRAVVGVNEYDPDLSPWQFGVFPAWGEERAPAAGALFTERGIYRPGEPVYAKAIVRHGPLGALAAPAAGDSVRWLFRDREGETLRDTVVPLSRFGTADLSVRLPADAALGSYGVEIQARREGKWRTLGWTAYQVAEYRPPEFLVEVSAGDAPRFVGDTVAATVGGRYLFGAPMARAPVRWSARQEPVSAWEIDLPGWQGWSVGKTANGWEDEGHDGVRVLGGGVDTLDARGYRALTAELKALSDGRPARVTLEATVTDANRQSVTGSATVMVHPAEFYVAARPEGSGWFWRAGEPVRVSVAAVRPDGRAVAGVQVEGAVVRREWHRVRRQRGGGGYEVVGEWVSDTVATCRLRTAAEPGTCGFTPREGGTYVVSLSATDSRGRVAATSFTRWAVGGDWVPWNDEGQFRMDVVPDRQRYAPGDTATILVASPFTDAEAWITVERERVLEQRRIRIRSGTETVKIPITEAHAPNVFVSVVVVRGRSAPPGTVDDPGRPTLRVGYAELRVTPETKRLAVDVRPLQAEYRPGDTARVRVRVRDAAGRGQRGEVTLWAVDEGVLSLTRYATPDPLDLVYRERGLGMRLASNLVAVAPQVPEGQKGKRNPGGGGGQDLTGVLRSRFRPTAFFLGSVVTDENGEAVASGHLPDNVTTFRVMAVAVTAGDRFGSGESPLLATRPLLARPALPRFVREGDEFLAGVVVNHRFDRRVDARVRARVTGLRIDGGADRRVRMEAGRGEEARFRFRAPAGDSATFRFDVTGAGEADAVQVTVPIHPANRPVVHTVAGMLRDTATVEFVLPEGTDLARSRLELGFGTSPLALVRSYAAELALYPYYCSEQLSSQALPIIALLRAQRAGGDTAGDARARRAVEVAVRTLSRRQRPDGGIGLWGASDWTTPRLTAYAGRVLLEARAAGVAVSDTVVSGIAGYLAGALREESVLEPALAGRSDGVRNMLAERVAAADFLSRAGRPEVPAENVLLGQAARMAWEDRVLLAEVLARRGAVEPARQLLDAAWAGVRVRGTRAVLPPEAVSGAAWFDSHVRPAARLLTATLAARPDHPGIAPLVETLVQQGRAEARQPWNTQDYGHAVLALGRFEEARSGAPERTVRVLRDGRTVLETRARRGEARQPVPDLARLARTLPDGRTGVRLSLDAPGEGAPVFYHVSLTEVSGRPTFTPRDEGIVVERWYETLDTRRPVTSVKEGEVVRVRLRITVPDERRMVILDDPLPAGLEAVDLTLRTVSPFSVDPNAGEAGREGEEERPAGAWSFGSWDSGMWSPFDHKEIRDDRVLHFARVLWKGSYGATYLARATTAGRFVAAPAHAEEMYNPGVHGRSGGGTFVVEPVAP